MPANFNDRIKELQQNLDLRGSHQRASSLPLKEQVIGNYSQLVLDELTKLFSNSQLNEEELVEKLKEFLAKNWERINGTCLAYTALPEHPLTDLLCDVAEFVAEETNKTASEETSAVALLMPTVNINHSQDPSKNLDELDLKSVLKTHVLGREGKYLVPVEILIALPYDADLTKIPNPYYDIDFPDDYQYLSQGDIARLQAHHPITESWFNTKRDYEQLIQEDTTSLLGQLSELTRLMLLNSTKSVGTEEIAAKGGMIAVNNFFEFYDKLSEDQKSRIPGDIRKELTLLRDYGLPEKDRVNKNLPSIGSCLATRHDDLKKAIKGHEAILSSITISAESKQKLLTEKQTAFEDTRQQLQSSLEEQEYTNSHDPLGITKTLLEVMEVPFNVETFEDLAILKHLTPREITEVCSIEGAPEKIVKALETRDNLVAFLLELPIENLETLLQGIKAPLVEQLIKSPADLSEIFIALEPDMISVICNVLKDQISSFLTNHTLSDAVNNLTPEQHQAVFSSLRQMQLNANERQDAIRDMLKNMSDKIQGAQDFKIMFQSLTEEQYAVFFEIMKAQWPQTISNASDFNHVITGLSTAQLKVIFEGMNEYLPQLINIADHVGQLLKGLSDEQLKMVFETMKERLPQIIKSADNVGQVLSQLPVEQCKIALEKMLQWQPKIFKSAQDFNLLFHRLPSDKFAAVLPSMLSLQPSLIQNTKDFVAMLDDLPVDKRKAVFELKQMTDILPGLVQTAHDFNQIAKVCPVNSLDNFLGGMQNVLPNMLKSAQDFELVLEPFAIEQRAIYFETPSVKDTLPTLIKTAADLNQIFKHLSEAQRTHILGQKQVKDNLPNLITTANDCCDILSSVSRNEQDWKEVFNLIKEKMSSINFNAEQYRDLLIACPFEYQKDLIFDAMKGKLPDMIENGQTLNLLFTQLKPEQRKILAQDYFAVLNPPGEGQSPIVTDKICDNFTNRCPCQYLEDFKAHYATNRSSHLITHFRSNFAADIGLGRPPIANNEQARIKQFDQLIAIKNHCEKKHESRTVKVVKELSNQEKTAAADLAPDSDQTRGEPRLQGGQQPK